MPELFLAGIAILATRSAAKLRRCRDIEKNVKFEELLKLKNTTMQVRQEIPAQAHNQGGPSSLSNFSTCAHSPPGRYPSSQ